MGVCVFVALCQAEPGLGPGRGCVFFFVFFAQNCVLFALASVYPSVLHPGPAQLHLDRARILLQLRDSTLSEPKRGIIPGEDVTITR